MILNSPYITGSITVTGNANIQGQLTVTGSLSGIASTASFALTLGGTGSVGFATTGAFTAASGSASSRLTQIEQVYATTGSNSFRATQSITGSLTVTGQIIAQTLNVQQVTSSIVYSSGSNVFGCDINSRQTFTGSFYQTGSVACFSNCVIVGGAANFVSSVTATRLSLNNTGTAARLQVNGVNSEPIAYLYNNSGTAGSVPGIAIEAGTNASDYALSVASSVGTTRLYIRGDGNIGIGNTSPQIKLDLQNGNVGFYNNTPSSNGAQLYLGDMNFAGGAYATSAPGIGSIASPQTGVSGDLAFYIYASAVCSRSEAMRIVRTSSGNNVGIATTCPTATLQIGDGSANSFLRIRAADGGAIVFNKGADNSAFIGEVQAGLGSCNGLLLYTYSGAERPIILYTAGTEKMRVTGGGYVGIGTNSPAASLHVAGNEYIGKLGGGGQYKQTLVGQIAAGTSGSSKKIAYVGFTHAIRVYVWANQSTPNGATAVADFTTIYGASNGGVTYSQTLGNVSGISIGYDNGGSPAYTINVTLTYSGAAPTINYIIEGINHDNFIYAL